MKRRTFVRSALAAAAVASVPRRRALAALYQEAPQVPPDVAAVTGGGGDVTLRGADIADLAARMRGRLLLAGDEGYDDARRILNPDFDKRPALIAQVTGTADIRAAVDFAREHDGLLLAVKCGGHSASGKSTCDGGMMIDLSPFRSVRVDPEARRARVTGGSLLGLLDHESMAYGLVVTMGTVSHTGVGGLVTGGGFGRVGRHFGLAIDNLTAVDVVTAAGELVHGAEDVNPDLFWGVRGGGGNFGIVTSFEFRLHPMAREVVAGRIMFPLSRARDVLELYGDYGPRAPDPLQMDFGMMIPPGGGDGMVGFAVCWSGDHGAAEDALAPIRRLGNPLADTVRTVDYVALQRSGDIDDPRAQASYLKSGFLREVTPELVSHVVERLEGHPGRSTQVFAQQSGGAIGRVAPDATAFSQRDAQLNLLGSVGWPFGTDGSEHIAWMREFWTGIEPHTHGFYVNDTGLERTASAIRENFRQNHERLVRVKNRWDPTNLFRLNTNIQPTVQGPSPDLPGPSGAESHRSGGDDGGRGASSRVPPRR